MKNERGLTLIELLAAITISVIIIGTATMLLSSVLRVFGDSSQKYQDDAQIKLTLHTLSNQLAESTQVITYTHATDKELRYDYYDLTSGQWSYKSLYFNASNHTLILYDFSADGNASNNSTDFLNASLVPNLNGNSTTYTKPIELTHILTNITFETLNTTTGDRMTLPSGPFPPIATIQTAATRMLYINFNFDRSMITSTGSKKSINKPESIAVKMLADRTAK